MRHDAAFMSCVTAWASLPPRPARTAPWPDGLDRRLSAVLRAHGIEQPYIHQAQAIESALAGENVVLATSAASGKTLAYNLPVLHTLLADRAACALYLFPTKALAHDQVAAFKSLFGGCAPESIIQTYDGDTPSSRRAATRAQARLLVTNPDMLHMGILPYHTRWARFFANLRYVILDEIHTYRGVFGGHVANLLRRLQRICRFYGSTPRFLCASATIANPRQLAEQLIEAPVTLVDEDGSPQGERHFILYNPPLVDAMLGIRRSAVLAAKDIAARLICAGVHTIVFARARITTEVLLGYLRDALAAQGHAPQLVQGYRGGYLPLERRAIEQGLREGRVHGVVATNALELGIDIGSLSACVMAGYPGTIAATRQQAGRAGRRVGPSVAILVASALPLDQYLISHPHYFFGRPVEQGLIDPDNLAILSSHLACAAFELPFEYTEPFGNAPHTQVILDTLAEDGLLHRHNSRYTWIGGGYPAAHVSLRTSTTDRIVIQDVSTEPAEVIGQLDRPSAPLLLHEGAVYLHAGEAYTVETLEWEKGLACVRPASVDYYTQASAVTEVHVVRQMAQETVREGEKGWGEVLVTTKVTGYRKVKRYTHEVLGWEPLELPEQELHTIGYWLTLSPELTRGLQESGVLPAPIYYGPDWPVQRDAARARDRYACRHCGAPEQEGRQHDVHHLIPFRTFGYIPGVNDFYKYANRLDNLITLCPACHHKLERARGAQGALGGLAYLLQNLAPLHLMCDPADLGAAVQARAPESGLPTVTLYDHAPGGAGLSARLYELHGELLKAALEVVEACPCAGGCPGCVGPTIEDESDTKELVRKLLEAVIA